MIFIYRDENFIALRHLAFMKSDKLLEGADALGTAHLLKGNLCGNKGTSCADQLATAIEAALDRGAEGGFRGSLPPEL